MKKILPIIIISLILMGFTIQNYDDWVKPTWFNYDIMLPYWNNNNQILNKVLVAKKELEKKGLEMTGVNVKISPHQYRGMNGVTLSNTTIIANNSYGTIYHELGHLYHNKNKGLIEKYAKDMKKHYPNIEIEPPEFETWKTDIREDFAEEFRLIFTGGEKRTLYPPFPNFYEWLLKNTQPMEIAREEAFNKLGGTQKLIDEGIVIGNTLGDYMLDKPIKRSELATVLVRLGKGHRRGIAPFEDTKGKWYEDYVNQIYSTGLIKGYPDGSFKGENLITRYELHMILDRIK